MKEKMQKTEFEKMLERKAAEEATQKEKEQVTAQSVETATPDDGSADTVEPASASADELQAELDQLKDQLLRARAEFDNYRKRILREMEQVRQTASLNLVRVLLPILDNLERALAHASEEDVLAEGVRLVYKQLMDALSAEGLAPIPARGELFDPTVHEALATVPSEEIAQGFVAEEYERGYKLSTMVVRPSKVIVSAGPSVEAADAPGETETVTDDTDSSSNE